jgi:integrase
MYRLGGRESRSTYAGSFRTKRDAFTRRAWVLGELAAQRVPDLKALSAEAAKAPILAEIASRWQASRVDVRDSTKTQHRVALGRVLPLLGSRRVDELTPADVAELVGKLAGDKYARESIRKSITALSMVLDFAGITPNPARDRVQVRLPLEEPKEPEPPSAEHVEAVARLLAPDYRLALLVLDSTGCRVRELGMARIGDLDEERHAWLVRAAVSKTRRPRWVELPLDLWQALIERLPPREDRDVSGPLFAVSVDRLRMGILRACKAAGVPHFSPQALRHRRISLLHWQGESWAEIGSKVGQRSRLVTADTYSHVLLDYREVDREVVLKGSK